MVEGSISHLNAMDESSPCGGALMLRRHKMLPHPMRKFNLTLDTGRTPSKNTGEFIAHSVAKSNTTLNMPPTPPTNSRMPSGSDHLSPNPVNDHLTSGLNNDVYTDMMRIGNDPPTPEFTPPRYLHLPLSSSTHNLYTPSSRSNSFVTAPEHPHTSSDDSGRYAMMTFLSTTKSSNSHLTSSDSEQIGNDSRYDVEEYRDNRGIRPKIRYSESPPKITGLGNMQDRYLSDEHIDRGNSCKARSSRKSGTLRQRSGNRSNQITELVFANEAIETTSGAKFYLSTQPTESIQSRHGHEDSPENYQNTLDLLSNTEVLGPSTYDKSIRKSTTRHVKDRQSYEHACVGASKSDGPQAPTKTLRHSKKQSSLRRINDQLNSVLELTSPTSSSKDYDYTSPSVSEATKPIYSRNFSSTTTSPRQNFKLRQEIIKNGGIPVLVIPERIKSSRASKGPSLGTTSSFKTGRSQSVNSASFSHYTQSHLSSSSKFPTSEDDFSSEFTDTEYFESTQNNLPSFSDHELSISDHMTRNLSRTDSLTAKSLEDHNRFLTQNSKFKTNTCAYSPAELNCNTSSSGLSIYVTVDEYGNPLSEYALSDQVTPYSQSSYETAGTTAEVSQALAVSFYAHQTRSIVVVQHSGSTESSSSPPTLNSMHVTESRAINTDMYDTSDTGSNMSSPNLSHSDCSFKTESLFRNPRNPPSPPAINCIPPTPRIVDQNNRPASGSSSSTDSKSLKEKIVKMQEAMLPSEDHHLTEICSQASMAPDRLHPFWRPSRIHDFSEDIKDYLDYDHTSATYKQAPYRKSFSDRLKRSIGMFSKAGPPAHRSKSGEHGSITRTSSSPRMKRHRFKSSTQEPLAKFAVEGDRGWGSNFKDGNGGHMYNIPGLGLRIENIVWKDLKRWASERKREKKRDELRRIIGEPKISTSAK